MGADTAIGQFSKARLLGKRLYAFVNVIDIAKLPSTEAADSVEDCLFLSVRQHLVNVLIFAM